MNRYFTFNDRFTLSNHAENSLNMSHKSCMAIRILLTSGQMMGIGI